MLLFKQNTAYEMRISDWCSDVCSSHLSDNQLKNGPAAFSFAAGLFFAGATGRKLHSSNSLGENPLPWLGNIVQRGIRVQSRQVQGELAPERQQPERRWDDRKLPSRGMKCVSPLSAYRPFFSLLPQFRPSRRTTIAVSP